MLILAWLVACGGSDPSVALVEVQKALNSSDLAAFDAVVDVDTVIPEIAHTCDELALRKLQQGSDFQPRGAWVNVLPQLGVTLTDDPDAKQHTIDQFRTDFPHLPTDRCPALGVKWEAAAITAHDDTHATATLPVAYAGHHGAWTFDLERRPDGWHVAHAHGGGLLTAWDTEEAAATQARGQSLVLGLADGGTPDQWEAARCYLAAHPEASRLAAVFAATLDPLEAQGGPLVVTDAGFFRPNGIFRNRHAQARVTNPTGRYADRVVVRFSFTDIDGRSATSGSGARDLVVATGPIPPSGVAQATVRAGGMAWPDATSVRADVVEVTWADGTVWRHPAVDAGAWSSMTSDVP